MYVCRCPLSRKVYPSVDLEVVVEGRLSGNTTDENNALRPVLRLLVGAQLATKHSPFLHANDTKVNLAVLSARSATTSMDCEFPKGHAARGKGGEEEKGGEERNGKGRRASMTAGDGDEDEKKDWKVETGVSGRVLLGASDRGAPSPLMAKKKLWGRKGQAKELSQEFCTWVQVARILRQRIVH